MTQADSGAVHLIHLMLIKRAAAAFRGPSGEGQRNSDLREPFDEALFFMVVSHHTRGVGQATPSKILVCVSVYVYVCIYICTCSIHIYVYTLPSIHKTIVKKICEEDFFTFLYISIIILDTFQILTKISFKQNMFSNFKQFF